MKNKKMLIAAIALVAVIALFVGIYFISRPKGEDGSKTFTMTVVHGDGTSKDFTITTDEEFLAHALIAEGIITDEGIETGMYNTVDGETAHWDPDQAYWSLYVGDAYATEGMNTTPIADGAAYKLEYTTGSYGG